ncbi:MAG: Holliday junction resolvase RuvX [Deltaproteobacteria bacterium]|nr:Holliday junction resolvase RuvX [Deltaproteobacteria bacterium]
MRVLSLDIGEKRIGFAISDTGLKVALGLRVYERKTWEKDLEEIEKIVKEHEVEEIVIGIPKDMRGKIGKNGKKVEEFAEEVRKKLGKQIILWDERFSTNEAHRIMDLKEVNHKKRKKYIDIMAAQIILQGYLNARKQE